MNYDVKYTENGSPAFLEIPPTVLVPKTAQVLVVEPIPSTAGISTSVTNVSDPIGIDRDAAAFEQIKMIRKGLGVDNELSADGQSIVNNLQGVLSRGLEKLENDLYSDQGQFVLELIQNADDNRYPPGCLPTLRFVISSDRILVCNNEVGFQSDHVKAICNIGGSTKEKHKQGYAGHKGEWRQLKTDNIFKANDLLFDKVLASNPFLWCRIAQKSIPLAIISVSIRKMEPKKLVIFVQYGWIRVKSSCRKSISGTHAFVYLSKHRNVMIG